MKPHRNLRFILAALASLCAIAFREPEAFALGNTLTTTAVNGTRSMLTDAAQATRFTLVKIGTDANHCAASGVGDIPFGIVPDEADSAEDLVSVQVLGIYPNDMRGVASGAITLGDMLVAGAAGTVRTLPVAGGTYYIIGRATAPVADGAEVPFTPSFPVQRVVS
jgi:hypothetical protein